MYREEPSQKADIPSSIRELGQRLGVQRRLILEMTYDGPMRDRQREAKRQHTSADVAPELYEEDSR